jgi:hypothetical protein
MLRALCHDGDPIIIIFIAQGGDLKCALKNFVFGTGWKD